MQSKITGVERKKNNRTGIHYRYLNLCLRNSQVVRKTYQMFLSQFVIVILPAEAIYNKTDKILVVVTARCKQQKPVI